MFNRYDALRLFENPDRLTRDLGLDIGSISVNTVLIDKTKNIIDERYDYCQGKPFNVPKDLSNRSSIAGKKHGKPCLLLL